MRSFSLKNLNQFPVILKNSLNSRFLYEHASPIINNVASKQVFGFGVVATGAIGIKELLASREENSLPPFAVYTPRRIRFFRDRLFDIKDVACGFGYTVFIAKRSSTQVFLLACGLNTDGQLGNQTNKISGIVSGKIQVDLLPEPQFITLPAEKETVPFAVACGRAHTLVVCKSASTAFDIVYSLFSLGNNTFGQCAREIIEDEIFTAETATITQVRLPEDLKTIRKVVCGQDHSLILTEEGTVFSAGLGTDGQTGTGSTACVDSLTRVKGAIEHVYIKDICSRGDTVLAISQCGRLFAWGNNEYGQIWPITDEVQVTEPIELPINECLIENSNEGLKLGALQHIASAGSMCAVLDEYGHVLVWGFGCLGFGPNATYSQFPRLIPPPLFAPSVPGSGHRIVELTAGLHHFIARSDAGFLWSWGAPRSGVSCLGLGRLTSSASVAGVSSQYGAPKEAQTYPSQLALPIRAEKVFCGVDHTIVVGRSIA